MPGYPVTKSDLIAIQKGDRLIVKLDSRDNTEGLVYVKKENRQAENPFDREQTYTIPAPVTQHYTYDSPKPSWFQYFEMMSLYAAQGCHVTSVFSMLRPGDEITFHFYPDAASNGYAAKANVHGDQLYLYVARKVGAKIKRFEFILSTGICPENSARMCQGAPSTSWYKREQKATD